MSSWGGGGGTLREQEHRQTDIKTDRAGGQTDKTDRRLTLSPQVSRFSQTLWRLWRQQGENNMNTTFIATITIISTAAILIIITTTTTRAESQRRAGGRGKGGVNTLLRRHKSNHGKLQIYFQYETNNNVEMWSSTGPPCPPSTHSQMGSSRLDPDRPCGTRD